MSVLQACRVCGGALEAPALDLAAPALTTANLRIDTPTRVYVCSACGHSQSPDPLDLEAYYDSAYKISLESEEHDQLYEVRDGKAIYRTDRQAEAVLQKVSPPPGALVLDYGAGKAQTLQKLLASRTDLVGHVYDVSEDYRRSWAHWLSKEACATYSLPDAWRGRFDLITAHYVLEHVPDPPAKLRELAGLLAPGGRLFFTVPDWSQNNGDLLVADHINHFSAASLARAAAEAGLALDELDSSVLPSAFVAICSASAGAWPAAGEVKRAAAEAQYTCGALAEACRQLDADMVENSRRVTAVYGAGFYGCFLLTRATGKTSPVCCLDNNRHYWGKTLLGVPIRPPDELPADVEVVYVGLNPARARTIVDDVPVIQRPGLKLVFINVSKGSVALPSAT